MKRAPAAVAKTFQCLIPVALKPRDSRATFIRSISSLTTFTYRNMKEAICTIKVGNFNFSKPRNISRAVVEVESVIAVKTPRVPLIKIPAAAIKPS